MARSQIGRRLRRAVAQAPTMCVFQGHALAFGPFGWLPAGKESKGMAALLLASVSRSVNCDGFFVGVVVARAGIASRRQLSICGRCRPRRPKATTGAGGGAQLLGFGIPLTSSSLSPPLPAGTFYRIKVGFLFACTTEESGRHCQVSLSLQLQLARPVSRTTKRRLAARSTCRRRPALIWATNSHTTAMSALD